MFNPNVLAAAFLFAFVVVLIQAFVSLIRIYRANWGLNWFIISMLICLWFLISWRINAYPQENSLILFFLYNFFIILVPVFYFKFLVEFLKIAQEKKKTIWSVYGLGIILLGVNFLYLTPYKNKGFFYPLETWGNLDIIQILFLSFFVLIFIYSFYLMFRYYNRHSDIIKRKIRDIFIASLLGFAGGSLIHFPVFNNYSFLGICFLVLAVLIVSYVLVKNPSGSLKELAGLMYIFVFVAVLIYLFHQLLVFLEVNYLGGVLTDKSLILGIFESLIFALIFLSFLRFLEKSSDFIFYRGKKPNKVIKDIALEINKELDFETLLRIIRKEFKNILGAEEVKILILQPGESTKVLKDFSSVGLNFPQNSSIFKIDEVVVSESRKNQEKNKKIREEMKRHNFEVAIPLILEGGLRGIIFLGEKHMKGKYTEEDLDFLKITSPHIAIAIHNSLLHEELEECNLELEGEVKKKMENIRRKNQELEELLKSQTEFLDIASHQLRTPMSVIKGMLSIIQEKDISEKRKKKFLNSITQNAFRLEEIIETILTASELDSGNFGFELGPVQLKPLLKSIKKKEKMRAQKKSLKFKLDIPRKNLLPVYSNESYLKQAIETVVDNAFQYTQEGSVTVKLAPKKNFIDIEIKDTGIGIPAKERDKIFNKFSRCRNAVETYGNGSGLGLFVAYKIIHEYHRDAKIYVKESKIGKGTTIVISLPVVKSS